MTEKLFYEDSLQTDFEGTVLSCEKDEKKNLYKLVLDRTLFYPEGGGQPCDRGNINGLAVTDVREINGEVVHYISVKLEKGDKVFGKIDFDNRLDMMQQHSGEHMVSGIINRLFGYDNVGFHIGSEFVTLDFNGFLTEADIAKVEKLANQAIYENQDIVITYPTKEELENIHYRSKKEIDGQVRIVATGKCDICACCGTHLKSTGSVGIIKLVNAQKYKEGVRIFMLAGGRALKDYRVKNNIVLSLSAKTSSKPYETEEAVDRLMSELNHEKYISKGLKDRLIDYMVKEIPENTPKICLFEEDMTPVDLRKFCSSLSDRAGLVLVLSGDDEKGYKYALGSLSTDVREIGKLFNNELKGKGGGTANLIQGNISADRKAIEKFVNKL